MSDLVYQCYDPKTVLSIPIEDLMFSDELPQNLTSLTNGKLNINVLATVIWSYFVGKIEPFIPIV